jgi:hypothetical protein
LGKRWRFCIDFWTALDTNAPLTIGGTRFGVGEYYLVLDRAKDGSWSLVLMDAAAVRAKKLDATQAESTTEGTKVPMTYAKLDKHRPELEIDEVVGEDAGPDHVDLVDVDVGRAGRQDLLVERQALGRRVRRRDHLDLVAGRRGPGVGAFLAELELEPDRAAGDRDGRRLRAGERGRAQDAQRRALNHVAHGCLLLISFSSRGPLP